jgi:hypothetical protein
MATDWEITAQRQIDKLTPQGAFEGHMEVNFATIPEGIPGMVEIPLRSYNADFVRDAIDARVQAIKAVQGL